MNEDLQTRRVAVTFVGPPPVRQIARASGVSEVEVDGRQVRCLVSGSIQPFLEALHGYEVIGLTSSQPRANADEWGEPSHEEGLAGERGGG
jgi:hypothetical protein